MTLHLQSELAYNASELALSPSSLPSGLMIHMPPQSPSHQQSFVIPADNPHPHQPYFGHSPIAPLHDSPRHPHVLPSTVPLPSSREPYFRSSAPTTPLSIRKSRSQSRPDASSGSESPSPKSPIAPRISSTHQPKRRNWVDQPRRATDMSRRLSENGRRTADHTRPPMPKMASNGVDFVNFTPDDSMRILTGVAPSGSSKTKARREKEAMEKRRRLSQAALRAVQAVGGSIESLVEEGLLV